MTSSGGNKTIAHLDLDSFFVSVERLADRRLNDKPVLVGGTGSRGVVASCSYEARKFGVHSAMPMRMALQLCPNAIVIKGDSSRYTKYSNIITEIIRQEVPLFEKTSIDEFYLDLTGMDKFFGCFKLTSEIRDTIIKETGLPISFGLSINKTVAKVATGEAKPNNRKEVPRGEEIPFLSPLSVQKIPMVGEKTTLMLSRMGIKKIRTLQQMPVQLMEKAMGKNGVVLWKKANGICNAPVIAYHEKKSISLERTFQEDTTHVEKLETLLIAMAENLAFQLRQGNKLTACVTVKVRYSDFNTYTLQKRIPYTANDHQLIAYTKELFEKLYHKRLLVRLVGLRFSHLVGGGHQINMFEDNAEMIRLYQAMDHVRNRFGLNAVKRARTMESTGLGRMNPFNGMPPIILAHRRA
ncbi:MAG TPA: DNA polymerase IV [Cryomorphaceae bacterium]|nr:DNA polymerase IV [Owenweeksia sp.]MBF98463.1 DNA polymerase IV [Owenweeksia sp.]HAD97342.1 DNA polymerase IV [Cryomorphaceae bacterium]HCQ14615.1 DNA polymerase IV [Cryomorphaceae bacterium]|tara:strand:- start:172 stop:1398 length:1227 start_codon:yes stop_codon:yes gene_type:complete